MENIVEKYDFEPDLKKTIVKSPLWIALILIVMFVDIHLYLDGMAETILSFVVTLEMYIIIGNDIACYQYNRGYMNGSIQSLEFLAKVINEKKQEEFADKYDPKYDDSDRSDELRESREYQPDRE